MDFDRQKPAFVRYNRRSISPCLCDALHDVLFRARDGALNRGGRFENILCGDTRMVRCSAFFAAVLILVGGAWQAARSAGADAPPGAKVRIGVYDNRAVAIAFAASSFNPVKEKMKAYAKAEAAGDDAAMKELKAWGETYQHQLHYQGFCRVPVDDLLQPVQKQVAELGREHDLAAITMQCEFTGDNAVVVDITDDLVKLFNPSEKALEHVRNIRNVKPVPLTDISDSPKK
jgi:hypothetical protein